jgi:hypothetical protein
MAGKPKDPEKKMSKQYLLSLTPKQAVLLEQLAASEPIPPVTWIRRVVLREIARKANKPIRGNVLSGKIAAGAA